MAVGRYAKAVAKPGKGEELARILLDVARALEAVPGCELYVINRAVDDPDTVWVTEIWRSQDELDASLQAEGARERIGAVRDLVEGFERIDLEPLGGVGYPVPEAGWTRVALGDVEDMAAKHGFGEMGEARFAHGDLETRQTGLSLQRLRPGRRQMFAHHHQRAEEVYVILEGSGTVTIDGERGAGDRPRRHPHRAHVQPRLRGRPGRARAPGRGPARARRRGTGAVTLSR